MTFKNTLIQWFKNIKYLISYCPIYIFIMIILSVLTGLIPLFVSYFGKEIIDILSYHGKFNEIISIVLLIVFFQLSFETIYIINDYLSIRFSNKINLKIKEDILKKIRHLKYEQFYDSDFLDALYRSSSFSAQTIQDSLNVALKIIEMFIYLLISICILSSYSMIIFLIILLFSVLSGILSLFINKRKIKNENSLTHLKRKIFYYETLFKNKNIISDSIINNYIQFLKNNYFKLLEDKKSIEQKNNIKLLPVIIINIMINIALKFSSYFSIIFMVISKNFEIGIYYFLISIVFRFSNNIVRIISNYGKQMNNSYLSLYYDKVFQDIEKVDDVYDDLISKENFSVEFINVHFTYPKTEKSVLKNISFKVEPGESLGIVGENGSGKTTILKLIIGLYGNYSGKILINGVDLEKYSKKDLCNKFSVIFQDFNQYALSYYENIYLGNVYKKINYNLIDRFFEDVGLEDKVNKSPLKGNTELTKILSKNSEELSTGQWQKVALLRALYRDSGLFVFDEPVASLDSSVEGKLFTIINNMKKTRIIVSHRLADMINMDKIIVLKDGEIIGFGNHMQLMEENSYYKELYLIQSKKYK